jgi:putative superfamily III holin-X
VSAQDTSTSDLVKQLSDQTSRLVHRELELLKAELATRASKPVPEGGSSAVPAYSPYSRSVR